MKKSDSVDWFKYWEQKADEGELSSMDRSGYTIREFLIYINSINKAFRGVSYDDIILDIGGGAGYTSLAFQPFIKQMYLADFSAKMIKRARSEKSKIDKTVMYQDSLPDIIHTKEKKIKFSKIIIGSVIQYLNDYEEIACAFDNLFDVLKHEGVIILTHIPDFEKKDSFIKSFQKLDWPINKIESAVQHETNERFWLNFDTLSELSTKAGFSKCEKKPIPGELFQSTHMFDMVLIK